MQRTIIALALFGIASITAQSLRAQPTPRAVVADPAADKRFPAAIVTLTITSHGSEMDGFFYLASGSTPHGTVVLLHGLPGYEMNGDLAQSIRRAGWNVLLFNYRGTWGSPGRFSQSSAIEDTASAVRFVRDPVIAAKYRIDPRRLVIVGHSFGGFLAGYEGTHDARISAIAMISATNLGRINADPEQRETRIRRWQTQLHPVPGTTAPALFAEAQRHANDWNYVHWADALRTRPLLLIEADDQNHADMEALASALYKRSGIFERRALATDHNFSDHRIALQAIIIDWLQRLPP